MEKHEVIIYMRSITLDVVIPEKYVWEFMKEFGENFATHDTHSGTTTTKAVNNYYYSRPNDWHIEITISENLEKRFYAFLSQFCQKRKIR